MSDIELKPCPFCGGEAEMLNYSESEWLVYCPACGGAVEKWRKTEAEAIEQWNTRKPMDRIVAQLEAYSDADEAEQLGTIPIVGLADAIKIVKAGGNIELPEHSESQGD